MRFATLLLLLVLSGGCAQQQGLQTEPLPPEGPSLEVNPVGTFQFQMNYNDPMARRVELVTGQISIERNGEELRGEITSSGGSPFTITFVQVSRSQLNVQARTPDGHVTLRLNFVGQTFTGQWEAENRSVHAIRGNRR